MANDIVAVMEKGENADLVKDQFAGMFVEVCFRWFTTWRKLLQTNWFWYVQTAEDLWFLGGEYDFIKIISVTF